MKLQVGAARVGEQTYQMRPCLISDSCSHLMSIASEMPRGSSRAQIRNEAQNNLVSSRQRYRLPLHRPRRECASLTKSGISRHVRRQFLRMRQERHRRAALGHHHRARFPRDGSHAQSIAAERPRCAETKSEDGGAGECEHVEVRGVDQGWQTCGQINRRLWSFAWSAGRGLRRLGNPTKLNI